MTKLGTDDFVAWLADRHPALRRILKGHLERQGELLVHVFFGDLTRWYVSCCEAGDSVPAQRLAADLEEGLRIGADDVDNLLHVSFLENLGHERRGAAWELLPFGLKAGFDQVHAYSSAP